MNHIDQVLFDRCPDGVGKIKLGEVVEILNGYAFKSSSYVEGGIRVIRISNVQKGKIVDADPKFYPLSSSGEIDKYLLEEGDLLMSLTGNVGRVGQISSALLPAGLNQRVACIRVRDTEKLDLRYLYHLLDDSKFENDCLSAANGSAQANLSTEWLKEYMIPLPPIEVQSEIVNILDTFTELEAGLEAELEARKYQYDYYRDRLLGFGDELLKWVRFGDVASIVRGASPRPIQNFITDSEVGIPWIKIGDTTPGEKFVTATKQKITEEGARNSRYVSPGDFILSNSMSFGRPYISQIHGCIHDGWLAISNFEEHLNADYLYHVLQSHAMQMEFSQRASNGTVSNLNADIVKSVLVPLRPLGEQVRIAGVLNSFEMILSSTIQGLPAEIAARHQQYEYYRNKLLTFKELEVA